MAYQFLFTNNAQTTLAGSISNVAVTANLAPGSGALFPNPSAGQAFPLTFTDAATGLLNEIVYVTARSGDTITMVRAQEGTSALAWSAGDNAALLVTAGALQSFTQPSAPIQGQCRLSVTSTTVLTLSPYQGNQVSVNGAILTVPSGGITASNSGLSNSTLYYVYVSNPASPTLTVSATGHVTASNGVEVMNGDATKSLVGMIRTNASGQFVDSSSQRFCANWFNRAKKVSKNTLASNSSTSGTPVDIMPSNHAEFLAWADDAVGIAFTANGANSFAGSTVRNALGLDGAEFGTELLYTVPVNASSGNLSLGEVPVSVTEGYHYATAFGYAGGNTASWTLMNIYASAII